MNLNHLHALELRLSHERSRYAQDRSEIRKVWIAQIEKEIASEMRFLNLNGKQPDMSVDEIAKALAL